ncbi:hypothetical protein AVEN_117234-2-1, partial [Araneus ventricosus]
CEPSCMMEAQTSSDRISSKSTEPTLMRCLCQGVSSVASVHKREVSQGANEMKRR